MIIGPVFGREVVTAPRRTRFYLGRAAYPAALLILMCTAWLLLAGTQVVQNVGDFARFGTTLFQLLAPLQLALTIFFSALLAASAVAQEKDRRTLVLLLLTNLTNSELVLGKLLAALLGVLVLVAAAFPFFVFLVMFGGVSLAQVLLCFAVTLASALAAGSLGSTIALWREKTFQTLAVTGLCIVFWIAIWEAVSLGAFGESWQGVSCQDWAIMFSPWQAMLEATRTTTQIELSGDWYTSPIGAFLLVGVTVAVGLNTIAIARVRVWNPSREVQRVPDEETRRESLWSEETSGAAGELGAEARRFVREKPQGRSRDVWNNPILWREIRTAAYGRKMLVIRAAYVLFFACSAGLLWYLVEAEGSLTKMTGAAAMAPLFVASLLLVNALAVTSLTGERDHRALDLLLVTDLSPKEFLFGKLGGVFYNTKEMWLLPIALCVGMTWMPAGISAENLLYLLLGLGVMYVFVSVLGIHCGMAYDDSRSAIAASIGTVFFLVVGVATCMRLMIAFSGSFTVQLQPFLAFMLGGGVGLYVTLGGRNPSPAIALASLLCPFATFYALTSFMLDYTLTVFLVVAAMYGFATAAMLVPALFEFDVATGRTTSADE